MMFMILDDDGDDDDAVDGGKNKYQQKNPKWRLGILSGLSSSSSLQQLLICHCVVEISFKQGQVVK